jgi:hypothetical protein
MCRSAFNEYYAFVGVFPVIFGDFLITLQKTKVMKAIDAPGKDQ